MAQQRIIDMVLLLGLLLWSASAAALPSRLSGEPGQWQLLVDDKPFALRGVGCARHLGRLNSDYLQLAEQLGANALRTWGSKNTGGDYLDAAWQRGLQVNAGIWLPHVKRRNGQLSFSYRDNPDGLAKLRDKTLGYVRRYKNHPAVMMWTVGNEVIHSTADEAERHAFTAFLQQLVSDIRAEDPQHLIAYASAGWKHLGYLSEVPALDIIGVNAYGSLPRIQRALDKLGDKRPLLFTELGPLREADQPRGAFGHPVAPSDERKARDYRKRLDELNTLGGHALGAFVFRLGDPKPDDLHWWNLSVGQRPRQAFYTVREIYTGKTARNLPPRCLSLEIQHRQLSPGKRLKFNINARDPENDGLHYTASLWPLGERGDIRAVSLLNPGAHASSSQFDLAMPDQPGDYLLLTTAVDESGNICLGRATIRATPQ